MADSAPVLFQHMRSFDQLHTSYISSLAFSPDGSMLASASADGSLVLTDVRQRKALSYLDMGKPLYPTCLLWPHVDLLVVGRSDGGVQLLEANTKVSLLLIFKRRQGHHLTAL